MAMKVKSEALQGIECAHQSGRITAADCQHHSSRGEKNKECVAFGCLSVWRTCPACIQHGTIDVHSRIMDANTGLCRFHVDNGEDIRRSAKQKVVSITRATNSRGSTTESVDTKVFTAANRLPSKLQKMLVRVMRTASNPIEIRVDEIRRFEAQPRITFNQASLRELGASLKVCQIVPIFVRRLSAQERGKSNILYELIDGERRWRASQIAKMGKIRAIVYEVSDKDTQFAISAIANFGREGHTPMEEAFAIKYMREELDLEISEIAEAYARSEVWVYQRSGLLRLHPKVQAMLNPELPKERQLSVAIASQLAGFSDQEFHLRVATEIVKHEMGFRRARTFIKKEAEKIGAQSLRKRYDQSFMTGRSVLGFVNYAFDKLDELLAVQPAVMARTLPDRATRSTAIDNLEKIGRKIDALVRHLQGKAK